MVTYNEHKKGLKPAIAFLRGYDENGYYFNQRGEWADAYARSVHGAAELPLGIVTAFIGAPFFMFLMIKNGYGGSKKK